MLPCLLETALADWEALGLPFGAAPRLLGELHGGRTNRNYLIAADGERWVLRLDAPDGPALGIDRAREQRILAAASAAGLAPAVLAANAVRGYMITAYIEGTHVDPAELGEEALAALLDLLARVRNLDVEHVTMNYRQHAANYLRATQPLPDALAGRLAELERSAASGLCHHDPVPANVVFQRRRPWLLDWEYAARGWPVLDLAAVVIEWDQPAARIGELTGTDTALLGVACEFYRDLCGLWESRAEWAMPFNRDTATGLPSHGD